MRLSDLSRILPLRSLRHRLMLTSLIVVALPIAIVGIVFEHEGRQALLHEKQSKLFGLTQILDAELGPGFDSLLADLPSGWTDRAAAIAHLSAKLTLQTDRIAGIGDGIAVGYYSKRLDAIITYGPSASYAKTIGVSITADHPGRAVMDSAKPRVEFGTLVRGQIMNAMLPIIRNDEVIGYIWANEFIEAIENQQNVFHRAVLFVSLAGIGIAFFVVNSMSRRLSQEVGVIVDGLAVMENDLRRPLPPLRDELGNIVDAINAMAKALLDARSLTENILASVADGIVAVDLKGTITAFNPAAEQMYSMSADAVIGKPYHALFISGTDMVSVLLDTLETGCTHIGVTPDLPNLDGTLKISASSSVLRDGEGQPIGAVVVLKDVSERDRLMVQVMRADRLAALGELTAGIAHEIRNPLTSIRGFVQYLMECASPKEWQHYGPLIIRQVDSLNHIITELLAFGRPRAPRIDKVHLDQIAQEMAFLARGKSEARIEMDLEGEVPAIEADGESLKQALLNLIINAMQAISKDGSVTVAVRRLGDDHVMVKVSDDGIGLAPDYLDKVFDPFFSTKPAGTGLGLAVVHRIVDAHQGVITLDSRLGEGTVVTIRLPVVRSKQESPPC